MYISNLPDKVNNNWPENWDIHLLKTVDLWFDDFSNIKFLQGASLFSYMVDPVTKESIISTATFTDLELRIFLRLKEKYYCSSVKYIGDKKVNGIVYKIKDHIKTIDKGLEKELKRDRDISFIVVSNGIFLLKTIENVLIESSAFGYAKQLENIINSDYNDDHRDGGDDNPEFPDFPINPSEYLTNYSSKVAV